MGLFLAFFTILLAWQRPCGVTSLVDGIHLPSASSNDSNTTHWLDYVIRAVGDSGNSSCLNYVFPDGIFVISFRLHFQIQSIPAQVRVVQQYLKITRSESRMLSLSVTLQQLEEEAIKFRVWDGHWDSDPQSVALFGKFKKTST